MKLSAHDLVAGYGKLSVLHGVDFTIGEGELVAVLGPNGAGKSTLLKSLARTLPVMSGRLELDGESMTGWRAPQAFAAGIAYVPQEQNVFGDLSVKENLDISGAGAGTGTGTGTDILEQVFDRFPVLDERSNQLAGSLSGGERQALAVSMALLARPKLLLLDEPTTGLSPLACATLTSWIVEVAQTGVSIVWVVEQNPEPVLAGATRAYVLAAGAAVYAGPASEISADRAMSLALD